MIKFLAARIVSKVLGPLLSQPGNAIMCSIRQPRRRLRPSLALTKYKIAKFQFSKTNLNFNFKRCCQN